MKKLIIASTLLVFIGCNSKHIYGTVKYGSDGKIISEKKTKYGKQQLKKYDTPQVDILSNGDTLITSNEIMMYKRKNGTIDTIMLIIKKQ